MKIALLRWGIGIFFLVTVNFAFSQSDSLVYFFDRDYNTTSRENVMYVGIGVKEKGKIKFSSFINSSEMLVFSGYFTDSTLAVKEGYFIFYDSLGRKESEGIFQNNKEQGLWLGWKRAGLNGVTGNFPDSSYFEEGVLVSQVSFQYHPNGGLASRNYQDYRKKVKDINMWDINGSLYSKTFLTDGSGEMIYYYENGKPRLIEQISKGKNISRKEFAEDGRELTKDEIKERKRLVDAKLKEMQKNAEKMSPHFPGGPAGFISTLEHTIKFPESFRTQIKNRETIKISFRLNQDGFAHDIKVLEFDNFELQQAIVDAFKKLHPWDMRGHKKFGPIVYTLNVSRF